MELWQLSASDAARRIADGSISAEALVGSCLHRIRERDDAVGAWIYLDPDLALQQARDADRQRAKGHGIAAKFDAGNV